MSSENERTNNDIFLKLGQNDANIQTLISLQKKLDRKLDDVGDAITTIHNLSKRAHSRINTVEKEMITKSSAMKMIIAGGIFTGGGIAGMWTQFMEYIGKTHGS